MKKFAAALVVLAVCLSSVTTYGAEPSKSSLSAMGLSGMQPMSDAQGSKVRGMGTAQVSGNSYAYATFFGNVASHSGAYAFTGTTFGYGTSNAYATTGFSSAFATGSSFAFGH